MIKKEREDEKISLAPSFVPPNKRARPVRSQARRDLPAYWKLRARCWDGSRLQTDPLIINSLDPINSMVEGPGSVRFCSCALNAISSYNPKHFMINFTNDHFGATHWRQDTARQSSGHRAHTRRGLCRPT